MSDRTPDNRAAATMAPAVQDALAAMLEFGAAARAYADVSRRFVSSERDITMAMVDKAMDEMLTAQRQLQGGIYNVHRDAQAAMVES